MNHFNVDKAPNLEGAYPEATSQIANLRKLNVYVRGLDPDTIQLINLCIQRTGLATKIVDDIVRVYNGLKSPHSKDYYNRYTELSTGFMRYVETRVKHLQGLALDNEQPDPWWILFCRTKKPELLEASNHIQEVMFAIHALSAHKFASTSPTLISDADKLGKSLNGYFELLKRNGQLNLTDEEFLRFSDQILQDFEKIQLACKNQASVESEVQPLIEQFQQHLAVS